MKARIAAPIVVAILGLAFAAQALGNPPTLESPAPGATFAVGDPIVFRASPAGVPSGDFAFYIALDPTRRADGRFTSPIGIVDGFDDGGGVYQGTANPAAGWTTQPNIYFWQSYQQNCPTDVDPQCGSAERQLTISETPSPPSPPLLLAAAVTPPQTYLKKRPRHKTRKRRVKFKFRSNVAGASFRCLFASGWEDCRSPHVFRRLKPGRYKFKAQAVVNGVEDPTPASWWFRVLRRR